MEKYILEFNEKKQNFHYNSGFSQPNTFGYISICKNISIIQCIEFVELIELKYKGKSLSIDLINKEFRSFLLTQPMIETEKV